MGIVLCPLILLYGVVILHPWYSHLQIRVSNIPIIRLAGLATSNVEKIALQIGHDAGLLRRVQRKKQSSQNKCLQGSSFGLSNIDWHIVQVNWSKTAVWLIDNCSWSNPILLSETYLFYHQLPVLFLRYSVQNFITRPGIYPRDEFVPFHPWLTSVTPLDTCRASVKITTCSVEVTEPAIGYSCGRHEWTRSPGPTTVPDYNR